MLNRSKITRCWSALAAALLTPLLLATAARAAEVHTPLLPPEAPAAEAAPENLPARETAADLPAEDGAALPESGEAPAWAPVFPEAEDWQLLLVNPWHLVPEDLRETLRLKTLPNGLRVDQRAYDDLMEMLGDCRQAGLSPLVCSAYRTQATQTRLYTNKIARLLAAGYPGSSAAEEAARWVAYPGTSEHQIGLAVDIVAASYQVLDERQEETAEQKWLMEHCWEYGFILRYPPEKSGITGIGYEPWHYRYVGRATALDMRDSGLCLEEYLDLRSQAMEGPAEVPESPEPQATDAEVNT